MLAGKAEEVVEIMSSMKNNTTSMDIRQMKMSFTNFTNQNVHVSLIALAANIGDY